MKSLLTATKEMIFGPEVKTFFLYEIDYDPPNEPLRYTDWSENVAYGGNVYMPFAIRHTGISTAEDGKINPITLSVGNVDEDRIIQQKVENFELIGKTVRITQLFEGTGDAQATSFKIAGAVATKGQVDFSLSIGFDYLLASVPARKVFQSFCRWKAFKKDGCQYTGPDETCGMTWKDCLDKGNTINFGGFPGVINDVFYF